MVTVRVTLSSAPLTLSTLASNVSLGIDGTEKRTREFLFNDAATLLGAAISSQSDVGSLTVTSEAPADTTSPGEASWLSTTPAIGERIIIVPLNVDAPSCVSVARARASSVSACSTAACARS